MVNTVQLQKYTLETWFVSVRHVIVNILHKSYNNNNNNNNMFEVQSKEIIGDANNSQNQFL